MSNVFITNENRISNNTLKIKVLCESKSEKDKPLLINFRSLNELTAGKKKRYFTSNFYFARLLLFNSHGLRGTLWQEVYGNL